MDSVLVASCFCASWCLVVGFRNDLGHPTQFSYGWHIPGRRTPRAVGLTLTEQEARDRERARAEQS